MLEHYWLVCYDIRDEKRLRRVARLLEGFGLRVQKSVFECWLTDALLKELKAEAAKLVDADVDDIRYFSLCAHCRQRSLARGETECRVNQKYYVV